MKAQPAPNTDVILVVKGAGLQKEDETLNNFLEGFLPAVTAIDQDAKVIPRYAIPSPSPTCLSIRPFFAKNKRASIINGGSFFIFL